MPNECWQSDFTHYRLATGINIEVISWLDDCTRYALHALSHRRITTPMVLATFRKPQVSTASQPPPSPTTAWSTPSATPAAAADATPSRPAAAWQVVQKNSRPNHPTTCGKVERFQQTLKKWLRAQPVQPETIASYSPSSTTSSNL